MFYKKYKFSFTYKDTEGVKQNTLIYASNGVDARNCFHELYGHNLGSEVLVEQLIIYDK